MNERATSTGRQDDAEIVPNAAIAGHSSLANLSLVDAVMPSMATIDTGARLAGLEKEFTAAYRPNPVAGYLPENGIEREAFLRRSYGSEYESIQQRLAALGPEALSLIADPGVVQHLKSLELFLQDNPEKRDMDAADLRKEFSQSLGMTRVFRGRAMTDGQFSDFIENFAGLPPRQGPTAVDQMTSDFQKILIRHANPVHAESGSVQSVSNYPDNAISMGRGMFDEPGKAVYLFTIEIPVLDVVDFNTTPFSWERFSTELRNSTEELNFPPEHVENFVYGPHKALGIVQPNGEVVYRSVEEGSERFIFGDIPPGAVQAIQKIPAELLPRHTATVWNRVDSIRSEQILKDTVPNWLEEPLQRLPNLLSAAS